MRFRLVFDGHLPPSQRNEDRISTQQQIRRQIHPQLQELCHTHPMLVARSRIKQPTLFNPSQAAPDWPIKLARGSFEFVPFVTKCHWMTCHLDILFLRRAAPGQLVFPGGDIDGRIKMLLDGLRMPQQIGEIPPGDSPQNGENPFYCLLEDDSLITGISIQTDRLLDPGQRTDVRLVIGVTVLITKMSNNMLDFLSD